MIGRDSQKMLREIGSWSSCCPNVANGNQYYLKKPSGDGYVLQLSPSYIDVSKELSFVLQDVFSTCLVVIHRRR